jgi:hypothetical protein
VAACLIGWWLRLAFGVECLLLASRAQRGSRENVVSQVTGAKGKSRVSRKPGMPQEARSKKQEARSKKQEAAPEAEAVGCRTSCQRRPRPRPRRRGSPGGDPGPTSALRPRTWPSPSP